MATQEEAVATANAPATTPAGTSPDQQPTAEDVIAAGKATAAEVIAKSDADQAAENATTTQPGLVTEITPAPVEGATTSFELPKALEDSVERVKESTHETRMAAAHDAALVEHKIVETIETCECEVEGIVTTLRRQLVATLQHLACRLCGKPIEGSAVANQKS